jgi:hypothetical protein
VNALRNIHAALVPGGLVVDTQPVSAHPPIKGSAGELGRLDMREWAQTVDTIDGLVAATLRDGMFALEEERDLVVTESFDDGAQLVAAVREWQGTQISAALADRVARERGAVHAHQDVRLRILRTL